MPTSSKIGKINRLKIVKIASIFVDSPCAGVYCCYIKSADDTGRRLKETMMNVRVFWEHTDLTAIVEVDNESEVYGMSGEFWFEQGGHGDMGFPCDSEIVSAN